MKQTPPLNQTALQRMANQPTSRKKYYLKTAISSKWTDSEFVPEFINFIGQRVRDIFIPNTQRFGSFYVETEQTANKLCNLFNIKDFTCRGRKLKAQKLIMSPTIFCIQLANINYAFTPSQFTEWVKSLHSAAFDIKLTPVQMVGPSTECIISFDSIDVAIATKQRLQNKKFRGFDINFVHWHVPRRRGMHSPREQKEELEEITVFIDDSSSSSTTTTPRDGPLYLTDDSIPAPPLRSPPSPPPSVSTANDDEQKDNERVQRLSEQMEQQHAIIQQLLQQHVTMTKQLDEQKSVSNHMNAKYSVLYSKYVKLLNLNTMLLWSADDVTQWIISLENGRFVKYAFHLKHNLNMENVNGSILASLTDADLYRFGIEDMSDQQLIMRHIRNLIDSN